MTDTDLITEAAKPRKGAQPLDPNNFVEMLNDAHRLVGQFDTALKNLKPPVTLSEYLVLNRLSNRTEDPGDGKAARRTPRGPMIAQLKRDGLVEMDATLQPTPEGARVLAQTRELVESLVTDITTRAPGTKRAGSRNLSRALKAVRRANRAAAAGLSNLRNPRAKRVSDTGDGAMSAM